MSIEITKCKECKEMPDLAWVTKGGNTPQNIWALTKMCRDCWEVFVKKCDEGFDAQLRAEACDGRF